MKPLLHGEKLINFNCRRPDGSMKHADGKTRQVAFCPNCQFEYRGPGCLFTSTASDGQTWGRKIPTTKLRREYAPRRVTNSSTGGRWKPEHILEVIVEYYERNGEWPVSTTAFRNSPRLPHSATVKRYFPGGVTEAVEKAKELMEKERII